VRAGLYAWRARAGARAGEHPTAGQKLAFAAGLATLLLTLNGPIHDLSDDYLFSMHMVQHLLLTMLVTPLLIAGTPGWMLRPALRIRAVAAVARYITTGPAAFTIFSLTIVVWHLPPLYNYALAHHPVHIVQRLCFLVASTIMWWPVMSTMPELPRLSYPKQML
jgi:putative membrane protein